jgi:hypothetical protein
MDKLFPLAMRARNPFAPDRCSVHLRILSRARLWLWAGDFQTILLRTRQRKILGSAAVRRMAALAPHMDETKFVRWMVKGSQLPLRWYDALRRFSSSPL